jgi:hypothetical protein
MDNPLAKLLFSEYAQRIGINPAKLEMAMSKMETAKLDPKLLESNVGKLVGEVTERQTATSTMTAPTSMATV